MIDCSMQQESLERIGDQSRSRWRNILGMADCNESKDHHINIRIPREGGRREEKDQDLNSMKIIKENSTYDASAIKLKVIPGLLSADNSTPSEVAGDIVTSPVVVVSQGTGDGDGEA